MSRLTGVPFPRRGAVLVALLLVVAALVMPDVTQAQESTAPTITSVRVQSNPGPDDMYSTSETIEVRVTFSENVNIRFESASIDLRFDSGVVSAVPDPGNLSEVRRWVFRYNPRSGVVSDTDADGFWIVGDSLELHGGSVRASDDNARADLSHESRYVRHSVNVASLLFSNRSRGAASEPLTVTADASASLGFTVPNFETPHFGTRHDSPDQPTGYAVDEIDLDIATASDTLAVTVTVANRANPAESYTFTGSADATGTQTFTYGSAQSGTPEPVALLRVGTTYDLTVSGEGEGSVAIGATGVDRWDYTGDNDTDDPRDGRVDPTAAGDWLATDTGPVPRVRFRAVETQTPYVYQLEVVSTPEDGSAYKAGEPIELLFVFTSHLAGTPPQTVDLWLGSGTEHRREAALISNYSPPTSQRLLYRYVVQSSDADTDGIEIGQDPLGSNADGALTQSGSSGSIRANLRLPAMGPATGHAVNGAQSSACEDVLCATLTATDVIQTILSSDLGFSLTDRDSDARTRQGFPSGYVGETSRATFTYGGETYALLGLTTSRSFLNDYVVATLAPEIPQAFRDRLALVLDDDRDALYPFRDFNSYITLLEAEGYTFTDWEAPGLRWADGSTHTVKIIEEPVTATFDAAHYGGVEGGTVDVTVTLGGAFELETVTLPITVIHSGDATTADYSGIPTELVFDIGETVKTFTVTLNADDGDEGSQDVTMAFGTLPDNMRAGGEHEQATISIADADDPDVTVEMSAAATRIAEPLAKVLDGIGTSTTVEVVLEEDPERTVAVPIDVAHLGGADESDYSGVPAYVIFKSGETSKSFTITAENDDDADVGESVTLSLGTLFPKVTAGIETSAAIAILDADHTRTVAPSEPSYTVDEGAGEVAIPVTIEALPGVTTDAGYDLATTYSYQTQSLPAMETHATLNQDYTHTTKEVQVAAGDFSYQSDCDCHRAESEPTVPIIDDAEKEPEEEFLVRLTRAPAHDYVSIATEFVSVFITDDDPPVTVEFEQATYTVAESDDPETTDVTENTVEVTVTLSEDPEREVVIPLTATAQGETTVDDYSGVPESVTFTAGGELMQTFTFTATHDAVDDDEDSVVLSFGDLPPGVGEGETAETTVSITDDDDPPVTVSFDQAAYTVAEGESIQVTVTLSADPERTVDIPLTAEPQGETTTDDYSGVPESVTFNAGETSKEITFTAEQDTFDDDEDSVVLRFGDLPPLVSEGTTSQTTVTITDDDDPPVTVSFGAATYTVAEGRHSGRDGDPERGPGADCGHSPHGPAPGRDVHRRLLWRAVNRDVHRGRRIDADHHLHGGAGHLRRRRGQRAPPLR